MADVIVSSGVLVDEVELNLDDLAHACGCAPRWVIELIEAGVLEDRAGERSLWRFSSVDLSRALKARQLQRDFEANLELAGLVCDLIEEVERLRQVIRRAGLHEG